MSKISIGIVGSGVFGRYHGLKCKSHPNVNLVGFVTSDKAQAVKLCKEVGGRVFNTTKELAKACDAIIIACPAVYHFEHAKTALMNNCHVLIEKPMVTNVDEGLTLIELAKNRGKIIQAGHQERYVVRAIGLDRISEKPIRIAARRMGPYSVRGTDASVTLDLMTHDLDLVLWLLGEKPHAVSGDTLSVRSETPDVALAFLSFPNTEVRLEASRVEDAGERIMTLTYPSGQVRIDFNAKTLGNSTPFEFNSDFSEHPEAKDSLAAGLNEFVGSIQAGRSPWISGQDGLAAVKIALEIDGGRV